MRVVVESYNPEWATQFQLMKKELEEYLESVGYVSIEHVGSTSVPGLKAKPIIDIDIVIKPSQLDEVISALVEKGGYTYMGEWGIPDRHAFRRPYDSSSKLLKCNLYACIEGSQALRNHLAVRDECRRNPVVREKYGEMKLELAKREWRDIDEYCEAKNDTIIWILQQTGFSAEELDYVREVNTNQGANANDALSNDSKTASTTQDLVGSATS